MSRKTFNVVDMFCGAGGESTGIMQAALEQDMKINLLAINHWERAIETHAANHPGAEHLCESVQNIDPIKAVKSKKLDLLWASPECTHHSVARGGRPRSDQSRASAWLILKWLSELHVERVIIENVPEFLSWGPLDSSGRPIKSKKGDVFYAFVSSLKSLGYKVDWRILVAADYGDPTTRRRLFVQAVKGRKNIIWPEATHTKGIETEFLKPWIPARDIIDWTIQGESIFNRKKPLADATLRRIAAGIEKYSGVSAPSFLAIMHGMSKTHNIDDPLSTVLGSSHHALIQAVPMLLGQQSGATARTVDQPVPTVATAGAISVIQPFFSSYHGGEDSNKRNHSIDEPIPTLDTSNRYAVVEPYLLPNEGFFRGNKARSIQEPLHTVTSRGAGAIIEPLVLEYYGNGKAQSVNKPLGTVTTKDRFATVEPLIGRSSSKLFLDIRFRMLKNHELKKAQGFPADYRITGNVTEQTKQIGNAVPVNTAKALTKAVLGA